jgi:asparagine synthase (glutamine-hydrolysing)
VGAYLSGGLDSSIITSLISKNFHNNLRSFSISFQEKGYDEFPFQQEMVRWLQTDHSSMPVSLDDIRENFSRVIWHCEKPLLRTAPVPMFLLSRLVREHRFKVVLTGEGADECFGGYDIFKEAKIRLFCSKFPSSALRPLLFQRLYPYIFTGNSRGRSFVQEFFAASGYDPADPFFSHRVRWNNTGKNTTFFSGEVGHALNGYRPEREFQERLPARFQERDLLSKAQFLEMDMFLSNYLLSSQGDRVAMANSLELRFPFLDHRVIDFAMRIPPVWKIKGLKEKYLLREAFRGILPESVAARPKHPYRAPVRDVFFPCGPSLVDDFLSEQYLKKTGYFDPARTRLLVERLREPGRFPAGEAQGMGLVGILSTQILHRQFIEQFACGGVSPVIPDRRIVKNQ